MVRTGDLKIFQTALSLLFIHLWMLYFISYHFVIKFKQACCALSEDIILRFEKNAEDEKLKMIGTWSFFNLFPQNGREEG